ncbi:MAG: glycosyltransferase family 2 protein [Bacteroidales bacterium]|nr:glycosyltransferase family 2 protein [Bacteroidales bacterium]MDD4671486.1 glycosyltransferase family 2 protein [Bacteroidales bacterium]MDY0348520.1 glycosyltransferase family 2 protein [Tenuifilaceae bacterium]
MLHPYFKRHKSFSPQVHQKPHPDLGLSVVLPSFNEPNLWQSLQSLMNCTLPDTAVEVIVVVNYPENSSEEIVQNAAECVNQVNRANASINNPNFRFFALKAFNMPKKHAGVGLARKTGMDEAAWRLLQTRSEHKIIACFDADATCEPNYFVELANLWEKHPKTDACSIRYAHPIEGNEFDERIYRAIAEYELHLRYYVRCGKFIGHPFSYQTVGSSMACSAEAYVKYGGMGKSKAGEDFYFLQKFIPHGQFQELNTTAIYPSPRISFRVPFGTGRAMTKYIETNCSAYETYSLESFLTLRKLIAEGPTRLFEATPNEIEDFLKEQPEAVQQFLIANNFVDSILEINQNTSVAEAFSKRFFLWFDAFKLLKYLNFAHEVAFKRKPISHEASQLLKMIDATSEINFTENTTKLLLKYRELDLSPSD